MYSQVDGSYVFHRAGRVAFETTEVAVLVNLHSGELVRHGPVSRVTAVGEVMRGAYRTAGMFADADSLVLLAGRFELDTLNRMVTEPGYAAAYFREHLQAPAQPISGDVADLTVFRQSRAASPQGAAVRAALGLPPEGAQ